MALAINKKTWVLGAIKVAISAGLIIWVFSDIDLALLGARLKSISIPALALAFGLEIIAIGITAWRWKIILGTQELPMKYWDVYRVTYISLFINQALPTNLAGDAFRMWHIFKGGSAPLRAMVSVGLDRIAALVGLVILITFGLPFLTELEGDSRLPATLGGLVLAVFASVGIMIVFHRIPLWQRLFTLPVIGALFTWAKDISTASKKTFLAGGQTVLCLFLSTLVHLLTVSAILALAAGLGIYLEPGLALALVPPVILASVIPLSYAGWGLREGAMAFFLGFAGIAPEAALSLSLIFGVGLLATTLPGGVIWLIQPRQ